MKDLRTLLAQLDPKANLAARHVWLIALFEWLRGDKSSTEASISRLQTFIDAVQAQPELQQRLNAWWQVLLQTVDVTTLLADFGFAPRTDRLIWQHHLMDALTYCTAQIRATGFAPSCACAWTGPTTMTGPFTRCPATWPRCGISFLIRRRATWN